MGISTKKTKQTTNQNTTATTTPINPGFVTSGIEGLAGKIGSTFDNIDPSKIVAPANPLQTLAGDRAGALSKPWEYGRAGELLDSAGGTPIKGESLLDNLSSYMNPYLKDVVDTSLADYDVGAGMTRAQDQLARTGDATFGGSSGAIQTALSNDAINRGRGALSAGLRSDAFNTGASLSSQDAQRRQDAATATAGLKLNAGNALSALGSAQGANDRANIESQAGVGSMLRDVQNQQNQAPITTLLSQIAAFGGLPLDLLKGSTSTGTMNGTSTSKSSGASLGDWLSYFAANAQAAAAASDIRLKQDIEPVGVDSKGRRWYEYAYRWDPETRHRGVMAHEVQETDPDAVGVGPGGYLYVDYAKLEA